MRKKAELTGQRFGNLVALRIVGSGIDKATMWLCQCDCGGERMVTAAKLRNGSVWQCGCKSKRPVTQRPQVLISTDAFDYFLYNYKPMGGCNEL